MESDARFFQRRAREELAAAKRALTPAARERRMQLADIFLQRFEAIATIEGSRGTASSLQKRELRENV